jgi:hypothetical protein
MDKRSQVLALADAIRSASAARDWGALAEANAALEAQLHTWTGERAWSPADRDALAILVREHEGASRQCIAALEALVRHLADLRVHREARIAYAFDHGAGE